jgi:hypothetical protein
MFPFHIFFCLVNFFQGVLDVDFKDLCSNNSLYLTETSFFAVAEWSGLPFWLRLVESVVPYRCGHIEFNTMFSVPA